MIVTCLASIVGLVINFTIIAARRARPIRAILQGLAAKAREISARLSRDGGSKRRHVSWICHPECHN